jgi:hypothetical protein
MTNKMPLLDLKDFKSINYITEEGKDEITQNNVNIDLYQNYSAKNNRIRTSKEPNYFLAKCP